MNQTRSFLSSTSKIYGITPVPSVVRPPVRHSRHFRKVELKRRQWLFYTRFQKSRRSDDEGAGSPVYSSGVEEGVGEAGDDLREGNLYIIMINVTQIEKTLGGGWSFPFDHYIKRSRRSLQAVRCHAAIIAACHRSCYEQVMLTPRPDARV